jgi:phosphatidylserine/phosphatidylglycerophosphate/cardiolipin synthase-like enzyme
MAILNPGRNCKGIYGVTDSGLLIDGRNYYKAFYETAEKAEQSIFIMGWQFDSEVHLLRGHDAKGKHQDVDMIGFFNRLCNENPSLNIYILAWDYSILFALEREWFQKWIFRLNTHERVHFLFDNVHAVGASHHQKLAIIDGTLAFTGGMDICSNRWDDRRHISDNPYRIDVNGKPYGSYHDVQAFLTGSAVHELSDIFRRRWEIAGGKTISLPLDRNDAIRVPEDFVPVYAHNIAISRTQAKTLAPVQESIREIRNLYIDAISQAEKLIYIENQYFSSQAIYEALKNRIKYEGRPKLEIILILPEKPKAFVEEVSLGMAQIKILKTLEEMAKQYGHGLGMYYVTPNNGAGDAENTYIHSKILIVDNAFLTVGSANTTNRSMGLDSELNVAWEAENSNNTDLAESIQNIRFNLLTEHVGVDCRDISEDSLRSPEGIVSCLNTIAGREKCRLRHIDPETYFSQSAWFQELQPQDLTIDPEVPILEENMYEIISHDQAGLFAKGLVVLNKLVSGTRGKAVKDSLSEDNTSDPSQKKKALPHPRLSKISKILLGSIVALIILIFVVLSFVVFTFFSD